MKSSLKKLFLLSAVVLSFQFMYAEDDVEKLCNQEIKKEIIDKTLVDKYCYETAKEYENKKDYGSASWYYLLSHNDKYNITNLKKYISKDANVIYANIGHSYVINSDIKSAKVLYEEFLKVYDQPNAGNQDDYKILFKLYPDKKEQLNKGLALWNEIYKPLLLIDELTKKYEEVKKSNNYKEAIIYLEKIIKIREKVLGVEHTDTAANYFNIGSLYYDINDYTKALEYYKKSLEIRENVLEKEHTDTATSYINIGFLYKDMNDYPNAIVYLKKFLEISEKVLGKEHTNTATIYSDIGSLYQAINDYPEALAYHKKSLEIREKVLGKEHTDTAASYNNMGSLYQAMNDYPKALEYLKKSLEIREKVFGVEHTDTAASYNNIGLLYQDMNDYPKALEYHKKSLEINEKVLGKEHTATATSYINIGLLYKAINDYPKALEYYKKSLEIDEKVLGKEHINTAIIYNNIGLLYQDMNDYPKALEYHKKSLEINEKVLGKEHTNTATSYNNIGLVYYDINDYPKALAYHKKSLEIREKVLGKNHTNTAASYNNIGLLYQDMNDYPKALEYHKKSLEINEKVLGKEHTNTATSYINIGLLYQVMNDYPKALEYYKKSLEIDEKVFGKEHIDTATSYNNIGSLYHLMQDYPNAYKYLKKSFDIFINNRDKNFTILDNKQKLKYLESNSDKLESLLLSANAYIQELNKNGEKDKAKKIKEDSLNDWLNYKGAIFDGENSIAILYEKIEDKNVKDKIEELNSLKQQLSKQYQTLPEPNEIDKYKLRIKELEKNISDVEIYLSIQVDEFKEELGLRNVKYQDISKYLNDNEIYVDFSRTKDNYFIFSLDNKNNVIFEKVDKEITNKIDENIKLFRENVQSIVKSQTKLSKDKLDSLNKDAKIILSNLYDNIVVNNLANKIDKFDNKKSLVFSLDGILNYLPLEALYDKQNNQYLIEKKEIKYVPSGREYIRLLNKKDLKNQSSQNVTMFTNPDYGLKLEPAQTKSVLMTPNTRSSQFENKALFSMEFKPLPGTQEEANVISKLYTNINDYNKDKATSQNLLKIKSPKILHISTHGFFLNDENIENPMLKSGLAFAGANMARIKGDSQGVMTGLKLAGLNLNDTQLVVLSACETGLGDIKGSEGVTGLNKAFIKAGARNIVMSLWSVADKETAELMQDFYQNVKETNKYQESLKESKMKMIKQDVHPYYWSAFIMNGI